MKTYGRVFVAVLVVLGMALGAGCSGDGDDDAGTNPSSDNPSSATTRSNQPQADRPLPKDQPLDLEQRHANGVVVRLTGIKFSPTSTTVSLEAFNGFTREVALNQVEMALIDNLDYRLPFRPPSENPRLAVQPGETLRGDLAFVGRPDTKAASLRLVINSTTPRGEDPVDPATRFRNTSSPTFVITDISVKE